MSDARATRAAARRAAGLPGRIIRTGEPKGDLHAGRSPEQRMAALWQLIQRAWQASGRSLPPPTPRRELAGEIFRIERHDD